MSNPSSSHLPNKILTPVKGAGKRIGAFLKAVWNDHDFWVRAIAFKCSASTVIAMGIALVTTTIALPFFASTAFIAIGSTIGAFCLYGIIAGGASAWLRLKNLYHKHVKGDFSYAAATKISLAQRITDSPRTQRFLQRPLVKKFLNSHAWKTTRSITRKQQDMLLTGIAGSGSLAWSIASAAIIVSQIALLPVVAVGGLLTITTAVAVGGLVSGVYGIYISCDKLIKKYRHKKIPDTPVVAGALPVKVDTPDDRRLLPIPHEKQKSDVAIIPSLQGNGQQLMRKQTPSS